MTPKQYASILVRYIKRNFDTNKEAAEFIGCSEASISQALNEKRKPTPEILAATGHYRKDTIKTEYFSEGQK